MANPKRWVMRCIACRGDIKSGKNSPMSWEAVSRVLGEEGWRVIQRTVGGWRVWGLHCPKCSAAVEVDREAA